MVGPPAPEPVPCPFWRAGDALAMAYDLLYHDLPDDLRRTLRNHFASGLDPKTNRDYWLRTGHQMGPGFCGRGCDWGAIQAGAMVMVALAIEGEDARATWGSVEAAMEMLRFVADYTSTPEGHMPNGNGYIGGDYSEYFMALQALKRRGVLLIDHPHMRQTPVWLAYETVPGQYIYDNRNQSGGHLSLTPTVVALAAHYGGVAAWLQEQAFGPERRVTTGPDGAAAGLLFGRFPETPAPRPELPLTYFSSSMGTVFSRSGWTAGDSCFTLTMEPPGQSHTQRDKGSFTFYSHGLAMAADTGVSRFGKDDHNLILIDGKGQPYGQGRVDAVVRAHLASSLADVTHMDLKPAYSQVVAYTNKTKEKVNWCELTYGKGLPLYWKERFPVHHADRYAIYVRAKPHAYAVIVDDVQKDDKAHTYAWLMHSVLPGKVQGRDVVFESRHGGPYVQSQQGGWVGFRGKVPAKGDYRVWALTRTRPDLRQTWWYCSYRVHKWTHRTYLAPHTYDWQWRLLKRSDKDKVGTWPLPAGDVAVQFSVRRGGRVAKVVAGRAPDRDKAEVVFDLDKKSLGKDWALGAKPDPQPRMDVHFLQPSTGPMQVACAPRKKQPLYHRLMAVQKKTVRAGYAAVLLPHDRDEQPAPTFQRLSAGVAMVKRGPYTDYLAAYPTRPVRAKDEIQTDGKFALVRLAGTRVAGYVLVGGRRLRFRGKPVLTASAGPVYAVADGRVCRLQAPQGAEVTLDRLGATTIMCNRCPIEGVDAQGVARLRVPVLPKTWDIGFSDDGRTVTVTGDGPRPLKIHAPKVIKCVVNGLSVYFSRAPGGHIYPKLDVTVLSHGIDPPGQAAN